MRHHPVVFAFVSAPLDTAALSHDPCFAPHSAWSFTAPTSPMLCSLWGNNIGDEGASALAAVLKETQITNLKCDAAP